MQDVTAQSQRRERQCRFEGDVLADGGGGDARSHFEISCAAWHQGRLRCISVHFELRDKKTAEER
jgi:hypothetical protein